MGEGWLGFPYLWNGQKPWWNRYLTCGEFWWSPEGPVSQIHSPHLHVGAPGTFSDLLMSVRMLKRKWGAESNGKLPYLSIPSKTAACVPEFAWKTCLWAELQHWFLSLQWKTCPWAEYSWWWWSINLLSTDSGRLALVYLYSALVHSLRSPNRHLLL